MLPPTLRKQNIELDAGERSLFHSCPFLMCLTPHHCHWIPLSVTVCQRSLVFNISMGFYFYFLMMCWNWTWPRWGFILPHLKVTNKQQDTEHEIPSIKARLRFCGTGRAVKEIMEANPTVSTSTVWAVSNKRKWKCLFLKVSQTTRKSQRLT